jgi:hypothetical protein
MDMFLLAVLGVCKNELKKKKRIVDGNIDQKWHALNSH